MVRLRNLMERIGSKTPLLLVSLTMVSVLLLMSAQARADGTLYLVDDSGKAGNTLYTVNTNTAVLTFVGPGNCDGLALSDDPSNFLFCSNSDHELFRIAIDGSGLTFVAPIGGNAARGLAFNTSTGILYGTDDTDFGTINTTTGAFTPLASSPEETEALAADPNNNLIYGLARDDDRSLMVYDIAADLWSIVGPTDVEDAAQAGLAFDPTSNVLYAAEKEDSRGLYRINPSNGATVFIGSTGIGDALGLTFVPRPVSAIPTLSEWGLITMAAILGVIGFMVIRRRKAAA